MLKLKDFAIIETIKKISSGKVLFLALETKFNQQPKFSKIVKILYLDHKRGQKMGEGDWFHKVCGFL